MRPIPLGMIDPDDLCTCPLTCECRDSQTLRCKDVVAGRACACRCKARSAPEA
jgi:hypothetical protein